jgi:membrane protein YdbS with pleckstrin-like domain
MSVAEPQRRLSPRAPFAWGLEQLVAWGAALAICSRVARHVDGLLATALWVVPLLGLLIGTFLVPPLRAWRWRWDLRPDAIDIRHGTVSVRHTLIPLVRVQHVETQRGLVEQLFDLSSVEVHTAAGSHKIPLLGQVEAFELRDRIASLTRGGDG